MCKVIHIHNCVYVHAFFLHAVKDKGLLPNDCTYCASKKNLSHIDKILSVAPMYKDSKNIESFVFASMKLHRQSYWTLAGDPKIIGFFFLD